jgi:tetratricopeptide (TPR) repeat protein
MERALELDLFNALFQGLYGWDLFYGRRYDDVIDQCRKALRTAPDNPAPLSILPPAYFHKGMYEEALAGWKAYLNSVYGDREVERALERGYTQAGYPAAMRFAAEALAARARKTHVLPWDVAMFYVHAGEKASALNWLERAFEVRDPNLPYMGWPDFDSLRSEPRYQALLRRMNLPFN